MKFIDAINGICVHNLRKSSRFHLLASANQCAHHMQRSHFSLLSSYGYSVSLAYGLLHLSLKKKYDYFHFVVVRLKLTHFLLVVHIVNWNKNHSIFLIHFLEGKWACCQRIKKNCLLICSWSYLSKHLREEKMPTKILLDSWHCQVLGPFLCHWAREPDGNDDEEAENSETNQPNPQTRRLLFNLQERGRESRIK